MLMLRSMGKTCLSTIQKKIKNRVFEK
jgi:hypothetical protein